MGSRVVLVVDDDPFSRRVVARKLVQLAEVVEAADGLEALAQLETRNFDLAVIDLEMPNFCGLDLIRVIRGLQPLMHIPIIVVTSNESHTAIDSALMAGATSFLLKPLNWNTFGAHITHVLALGARSRTDLTRAG